MANDSSTPIDTSKTAGNFNDFLASQGLGEIDPGLASIYKQGIKNSPMDDILAANNMDLDQLFTIKKPKPPLDLGENLGSRENTDEVGVASPKSVQAAIDTLGLSVSEKETLSSLLNSGNTLDTGTPCRHPVHQGRRSWRCYYHVSADWRALQPCKISIS